MDMYTVFPAELKPGDEIWDGHPGVGQWVTIEALCSGDQEILVRCAEDPELIHLPACERIPAFRDGADPAANPAQDAQLGAWYAGDLRWAAAAVAARCHCAQQATVGQAGSDPSMLLDEEHLQGWYAGDLESMIAATRTRGEARDDHGQDGVEDLRRQATRRIDAQRRLADQAAKDLADSQPEPAPTSGEPVCWYHGDLAAARVASAAHGPRPVAASPAPAAGRGDQLPAWYGGDLEQLTGSSTTAAELRAAATRRIQAERAGQASGDEQASGGEQGSEGPQPSCYHGDLAAARAAVRDHQQAKPAAPGPERAQAADLYPWYVGDMVGLLSGQE